MKDLCRRVYMLCRVCGNDQFETIDERVNDLENAPDETAVKCSDCGTIFTKAELIHDNSERIEMAVEEVKTEAIKEIEMELKKGIKKWKL